MSYAVKELFYTLQGEGRQTGRAAVFCRFTGCNLWTGREADRSRAVCQFCDTDFVGTDGPGGGRFADAGALADAAARLFADSAGPGADAGSPQARPLIVCTGGEPLLQLDAPLIAALHGRGFEIAVETNGTQPLPPATSDRERIDWICVSPKAGSELVLTQGDELKLVYPQSGAEPERFSALHFSHFYLQPMDGLARAENTRRAVAYCMQHPQWRLSLQTHKYLGIP